MSVLAVTEAVGTLHVCASAAVLSPVLPSPKCTVMASAIPGPLPQESLPDIPELLLNEQGLVTSLAAQEKGQQLKHIHGGFLLPQ